MSEELKPCPFCGSGNIEIHGMPAVMEAPDTAQCADCNACAEAGNWNTRVAIKAGQGEELEVVAWRWKTEIPEQLRGSDWMWSFGSHWSTGPKDSEKLMTVAQHERIVASITAPPATGVIVPRELLARIAGNNFFGSAAIDELRALALDGASLSIEVIAERDKARYALDRDTASLRSDYTEACADAMEVARKLHTVEAERDALRAQVEAMRAALNAVMTMDVNGHHLQDRLQFSPKGREILEKVKSALQATP